jgi:tetratricopeptide (TPR) repeat protein
MKSIELILRINRGGDAIAREITLSPSDGWQWLASKLNWRARWDEWSAPASWRQALKLANDGNHRAAAQILAGLVSADPSCAQAHFLLGQSRAAVGDWAGARESLAQAVELRPRRAAWREAAAAAERMCVLHADPRPRVVLFLGGTENVAYQGNMWLPVLEKLRVPAAVVVQQRAVARDLAPTRLPVLEMPSLRDLESLPRTGVRTVLYTGNSAANAHLLRFHRLNHFFINHGESDKAVNQSKMLMAYDKLLVAGPLAEERLRREGLPLRPGQVVQVGRPVLELALRRETDFPRPLRSILYAPTWEGGYEETDYTSVGRGGLEILQGLAALPQVAVRFRPHPSTGRLKEETRRALAAMKDFCRTAGVEIVPPSEDIYRGLGAADLLITDLSSLIGDFSYTGKPFIVTNPRGLTETAMQAAYPSTRGAYLLDDPSVLGEMCNRIASVDARRSEREASARQILGNFPGGSFAEFDRVIAESATGEESVTGAEASA